LGAAEITDALAQPAFPIGAGQAVDDVGERGEVDAAAGAHGFDAQGNGEMISYGSPITFWYRQALWVFGTLLVV
jgi:hypothetical protein